MNRAIKKVSEKSKAMWADPEWRIAQCAKFKEAFKTREGKGRFGVPDGMRKEGADRKWAKARESASKTMTELKQAGALADLDPRSEEALETAMTVMRGPTNQGTCLAAARLVLDFTKAKPASKSEVTVNKAEAWLAALTEQNDGKAEQDGTATDA